jgi:glycosyltransferase involved in cell wall biosynthesis
VVSLSYSVADLDFRSTSSIGIFNLVCGLLRELATRPEIQRMTLFTNSTLRETLVLPAAVHQISCDAAIASRWQRVIWDQWGVYRAARSAGNDWLLLPKGHTSFVRSCPARLAVYVHDIMPAIYADLYPSRRSRLLQRYYEKVYAATLRHARIIFTNTGFTRDELIRLSGRYGVPRPPPIVVAGFGFDLDQVKVAKKDQILLFVRPDPHKRTDLALDYLKRWITHSRFTGQVMCVGRLAPALRLPDTPQWAAMDRLPRAELVQLVGRSRAVVHVSEYEGIGMPPVEATLIGTAAVFSDVPATKEVMGDAGWPFANESYPSFADAMAKALATPEDMIQRWADDLRRRHNWRAVGDRVLEGLRSA